MAEIRTHLKIDQTLCGTPLSIAEGACRVSLTTVDTMAADHHGLVHGGFLFGLADYAAMLAVNDPNVVLGGADVKFLKPVRVGQTLEADARILTRKERKYTVSVSVENGTEQVFKGVFICFVLEQHVLA